MTIFEDDISSFFNDFGVTATFGAYTGTVILDKPDEIVAGGMVSSTEFTMKYRSTLFPGLTYKSSIEVDGVDYTVRSVHKQDDGNISIAYLSKDD